ncbi:MFS general substrate transporter [Annulohypoxylon maeteangense]|uniref:MFS general substrate transporter n=1 Tax=Annulohypoxylon maeteangense TaxID=1927788 RepID=UPI0020084B11|nr:MFS general substrate transporter [Annulohypoxylon maeteangense]KAI0888373.1 MFS general substrate transporter [Annulohypoxylon maeteangense]
MLRFHVCLFVVTIGLAQLCAQAGIGQTLAIVGRIGASFGRNGNRNMIWALTGYSLAIGTFVLIAGRLGDIYGHKRVFLAGFIWSSMWSGISGTAVYSNYALFIASRVFHGLGAALSLPTGLALLGISFPPGKEKAMAFTFVATIGPVGIIAGSASASLFTLIWWPIAYWTFAGILSAIAGVGYFTVPKSTQKNEMPGSIRAVVTDLDIPGAITGVSALVLISFAWNQAPLVGWKEPYLWVALILGTLLAILFVLVENYYAPKPLIPFYALSPSVSLIVIAGACGWSCFGIWAFYTWQFVENIRGTSPLLAAAYICPCIIIGCLTTLSIGFVLQRLGTILIVFGSLLGFTLGSALVATMPAVQSYWSQLFISVLVVSWAMDIGFPITALALSNAAERKHQGIAASLVSTVMNYGISIGLGIARTVESYANTGGKSFENKLIGYRAALYTALGLAGLGAIICSAFLLKTLWRKRGHFYKCHEVAEVNQI